MCLLALSAAPWEQHIVIVLSLTGECRDFLYASLPDSISPFLSLPTTASFCFPEGTITTSTEAADRHSQEVKGLQAMETVLPMGTVLQSKAEGGRWHGAGHFANGLMREREVSW